MKSSFEPLYVFACALSADDQRRIADRILTGAAVQDIAQEQRMSPGQIRAILRRVCLYANPELYCETVKASVKRRGFSSYGTLAGHEPTLTFLRNHRAEFG